MPKSIYSSLVMVENTYRKMFAHAVRLLTINGGEMRKRHLLAEVHAHRNKAVWSAVYEELTRDGWIIEVGSGIKTNPVRVRLLKDKKAL